MPPRRTRQRLIARMNHGGGPVAGVSVGATEGFTGLPHTMIQRTIVCTLLLAGLSACKSTPKEAELDANGNKVEYVWYTPTGSNLPVRVRKDQVKTSESQTTQDQNAMRATQQT